MRQISVTTLALVVLLAGARAGHGQTREDASAPDTPVTLVTNGWVDVRELLRTVASEAGLGLQIAPDVTGEVNVHLESVPLPQALSAVLEPVALGYEFVDNVLVVYKQGMVTRWLTFDYPVTKREGQGELQVSARRAGGSSGGGGGGGRSSGGSGGEGGDENRSHLTTSATMAVWPQVIASLQTVVFEAGAVAGAEGGADTELSISLSDAQGRSLVVNAMAGLVQVTAEWNRVQKVQTMLARLEESLRRQVAIEVKILEVSLRDVDRSGIDWSNLTGKHVGVDFQSTEGLDAPVLTMVLQNSKTSALLEALSTQGSVKVLSTPRISTLNNQKAVVRVVTEEVYYEAMVEPAVVTNGVATEPIVQYTPQIIPVGIVLDVTPQVGQDRVITLNVHPTISDVVRIESSPNADTQPVLSVRELDTVGKVGDGQTLVIAGLMSEGTKLDIAGVPILKDIPLLGYLFRRTVHQRTKTELVVLLTPVIMDDVRAQEMAEEAERALRGKM